VTLREAIVILLDHAEYSRTLRDPTFHQQRQIHAVDAVVNALEDFYPEVVDLAVAHCGKYREQRRRDGGSNVDIID
jgi:hypothetical protein